jgi:hypothetical protein
MQEAIKLLPQQKYMSERSSRQDDFKEAG